MKKSTLYLTAALSTANCLTQAKTSENSPSRSPHTQLTQECRAKLSHLLNICDESGMSSEFDHCSDAVTGLDAPITVLQMCHDAADAVKDPCKNQNIARFEVEAGKHRRRMERIIIDVRDKYADQCLFDNNFETDTKRMNKSLKELNLPPIPGSGE